MRTKGHKVKVFKEEDYLPNNVSLEARICLECPFPQCKEWKCKRLKEEKRRLKAESKNGKKSVKVS
jgi:hypothetical protein